MIKIMIKLSRIKSHLFIWYPVSVTGNPQTSPSQTQTFDQSRNKELNQPLQSLPPISQPGNVDRTRGREKGGGERWHWTTGTLTEMPNNAWPTDWNLSSRTSRPAVRTERSINNSWLHFMQLVRSVHCRWHLVSFIHHQTVYSTPFSSLPPLSASSRRTQGLFDHWCVADLPTGLENLHELQSSGRVKSA